MLTKYALYYAEVVPDADGEYYAVSDIDALIADLEALRAVEIMGTTGWIHVNKINDLIAKHKEG